MRSLSWWKCGGVSLILAGAGLCCAAERAAASESDAATATPAATPGAPANSAASETGPIAEFHQLADQWRTIITELGGLQAKYKTADGAARETIRNEWKKLIDQGLALQPKLLAAAVASYRAAPNENADVVDLLVDRSLAMLDTDDFETAYDLSRMLLDGNVPDSALVNIGGRSALVAVAGVSAYATNHYDEAEKYLTEAKKSGRLGELGEQFFQLLPRERALWEKEKPIREAEAKADDLPRVELKTSKGDIVLELFENEAPNTVANFISLVEQGFYNGIVFHRVLPQFMAQGGDPTGTGSGGPGYCIPDEVHQPNARMHFRGTLSMAKTSAPDSGGSQFFLTFIPTSHLDGVHTVFGRVISGMDVLAKLQRIDPEKPSDVTPDKIIEAKVLRKRPHDYVPTKLPQR